MNANYLKLEFREITYKVNLQKGIVTAIAKCILPYHISQFNTNCGNFKDEITAVGIARVNAEEGDTFNEEVGKKIARAKAEKEAFIKFKELCHKAIDYHFNWIGILNNTKSRMSAFTEHQNHYIKNFYDNTIK